MKLNYQNLKIIQVKIKKEMNDLHQDCDSIIRSLKQLCMSTHNGPEGLYNEYSLSEELINHLLKNPIISKNKWYKKFYKWEAYVKNDILDNRYDNDIDYWEKYIDNFDDRMDLIFDFAEIIFK